MSKTPWQIALLVLAMFLLMPAGAFAQEAKNSNHPPSIPKNTKAVKPAAKPSLKSVTLVSSDAIARKVAEEESASAQASKTDSKHSKQAEASKSPDSAVLEFHPTDSPPVQSGKGTLQVKNRKKSVLKNVHGSVYGATASSAGGAQGEGGAVGAESGNGRLGVYVEGQTNHANTPVPH
jgi:hypothetical protein